MKLEGEQVIAADRMTVWNAINDPDMLKRCIAGCQEMTKTSPTQFDAVVKQKIGPVSATFKGAVNLSDINEGHSLRLDGEGKGGVAGMAKGGALVTLTDVEGGTQLSYNAEASVAGKLAQLGSRLIDGVAQKMINSFFDAFKKEVESGTAAGTSGDVAAAAVVGTGAAAGTAVAAEGSAVPWDTADAHTGALHDVEAEKMLNPAIGAGDGEIDMDDPEIGDIDVSSVDGGPPESEAEADTGTDTDTADMSGAAMAGAAGVAAAAGAAVSGLAARAQEQLSDTHDTVREKVIAAGENIDEGKAWDETKEHLDRAASEAGDAVEDVYDAAKARIEGDVDRAKAEWSEAKTNASEALSEVKGAGADAYTAAKGYAAEEAKAPKIGPMGQPWYLWIIGAIVLFVVLWMIF